MQPDYSQYTTDQLTAYHHAYKLLETMAKAIDELAKEPVFTITPLDLEAIRSACSSFQAEHLTPFGTSDQLPAADFAPLSVHPSYAFA